MPGADFFDGEVVPFRLRVLEAEVRVPRRCDHPCDGVGEVASRINADVDHPLTPLGRDPLLDLLEHLGGLDGSAFRNIAARLNGAGLRVTPATPAEDRHD